MKTRKYLALLMAVLMALTAIPFSVTAEEAPVILTLSDDTPAEGEGWSWANGLLTLNGDFGADAIHITSGVTSAKLVLESNVTLGSALSGTTPALKAEGTLEIDAADYTLTLYADDANALAVEDNLILSGGQVYARNNHASKRDVAVAYGSLTMNGARLIGRNGGIFVNRAVTVTDSLLSGTNLYESEENPMAGIRCGTLTANDSTLYTNSNWYGLDCDSITADNCTLSLYSGYGYDGLRVDYRESAYASLNDLIITNVKFYDEKSEENEWGYEYKPQVIVDESEAGFVYSWVVMTVDGETGWSLEGTPANPAQAEGKVTELMVGGVNALKNPVGDGWRFDAAAGVLTLDNCTITTPYVSCYGSTDKNALIYYTGDLTIELVGENRLERRVDSEPAYNTQYAAIYGDYYYDGEGDAVSPLKIQGTGHLTAGVAFIEGAEEWWLDSQQFAICAETDLSGLRDGGSATVYCGVTDYPRAGMFRAFWCSPSYGDTLMLIYNDIEGQDENPDGFNWNNNDAWRAEFITADHYLTNGGKLILNGNTDAQGDGWKWANNHLTLSPDSSVTAVCFTDKVTDAAMTLTGDMTLRADYGQYGSTAVYAACDLDMDLGGHALTVPAKDGSSQPIFHTQPGNLTVRNGKLNVNSYPYDIEWAEYMGSQYQMGVREITAEGGSLTLKDLKANTPYVTYCSYCLNLELDYDEETGETIYDYYDCGPLTVDNCSLVSNVLYTESNASILDSVVNITGEDEAIYCTNYDVPTTILLKDSTVSATCTSEWGYLLRADNLVMDGCRVMFSAPSIFYGTGADSLQMTNMTITDPADCTIGEIDRDGYPSYAFLNGDGDAATVVSNMDYRLINGRLYLQNSDPLSGHGWNWKNNVLTLDGDTEIKAVSFAEELGRAKMTLVDDVTLDARNVPQINYQEVPVIEAHCDLEIDGGDRTLTLMGYGDGISVSFADLLISGGDINIALEQGYNPPLAIRSLGGNVTVEDAALTSDWEISLNVGWDDNGGEHPSGDLVFRNAVVENRKGIHVADGSWTVTDSTLTMTVDYSGSNAHGDIIFTNSIVNVSANEDSSGYLFTSDNGQVVFDNCEVDLSCDESLFRTWYYYEDSTPGSHSAPNMESIRFVNMTVTPADIRVIDIRETDPNGYYCGHTELADGNGSPLTALTATAAEAVCQHQYDHDYDADCNLCGTLREVAKPEETVSNQGGSASEDVSGVAGLFDTQVQGMSTERDSNVADYSYATINGYKVLEMGTVAENGFDRVAIPARYLYRIEDDFVYYAVRIINVPEQHYDTEIRFTPYFIIEVDGEAVTLYGEQYTATYNSLMGN